MYINYIEEFYSHSLYYEIFRIDHIMVVRNRRTKNKIKQSKKYKLDVSSVVWGVRSLLLDVLTTLKMKTF